MTLPLIHRAKWAFTTRRVRRADSAALLSDVQDTAVGDLIAARVERIGSHRRLQLANGRPSDLWPGDVIVAACGDRYAADQFEGFGVIEPDGCDLLAGGGVLGQATCRHGRLSAPTRLVPIGRLTDRDGTPLNIARYALRRAAAARPATVIGVVGTGMNSGKTTAAAALIRGLTTAGLPVAALKATGTGAFGDLNAYADAGAAFVADFTDDGLVSTYRQPPERIGATLDTLLGHAAEEGCTVAVVEIADGLLQDETAALLGMAGARGWFDGLLFAAGDALSALGGLGTLRTAGLPVLALSGVITRAPLAVREVERAAGVPTLGRDILADPAAAAALLSETRARAAASQCVSAAA